MDSFSSAHQFERALVGFIDVGSRLIYSVWFSNPDFYHPQGLRESFRSSPRLGRTNQFADLFGTQEEQQEYVAGILVVALILSCFFFCWGVFICILKCMGRGRVGFLAGGPYEATIGEKKDPNPRPKRGRIVFGVSALLFIIFTMLLLFLGFANLEETTSDMATGARVRQPPDSFFEKLLAQNVLTK